MFQFYRAVAVSCGRKAVDVSVFSKTYKHVLYYDPEHAPNRVDLYHIHRDKSLYHDMLYMVVSSYWSTYMDIRDHFGDSTKGRTSSSVTNLI